MFLRSWLLMREFFSVHLLKYLDGYNIRICSDTGCGWKIRRQHLEAFELLLIYVVICFDLVESMLHQSDRHASCRMDSCIA